MSRVIRRLRHYLTGTPASRHDPSRTALQAPQTASANALYPGAAVFPSSTTYPQS